MRKSLRLSAFWLAPVLAISAVLAQEATDTGGAQNTGAETVRGRVVDATGGALPGATVTLLTDSRENTETVATDETGR